MKNSTIHQIEILDQCTDEFRKYCKQSDSASKENKEGKKVSSKADPKKA